MDSTAIQVKAVYSMFDQNSSTVVKYFKFFFIEMWRYRDDVCASFDSWETRQKWQNFKAKGLFML